MIAYGVVAHEGSYLRSGWNWIDFISVVTAVPSLFTAANAVSYFEVFRMLRILRSLRSVKYIKGMQVNWVPSPPLAARMDERFWVICGIRSRTVNPPVAWEAEFMSQSKC